MPSEPAAAPITECPKYGGKVCVAEAGALCECYPGGLGYRKGLGIPTQAERDAAAANERQLPPGWDETHLEAYRDGYTDALIWAMSHDTDEILAVLERSRAC